MGPRCALLSCRSTSPRTPAAAACSLRHALSIVSPLLPCLLVNLIEVGADVLISGIDNCLTRHSHEHAHGLGVDASQIGCYRLPGPAKSCQDGACCGWATGKGTARCQHGTRQLGLACRGGC